MSLLDWIPIPHFLADPYMIFICIAACVILAIFLRYVYRTEGRRLTRKQKIILRALRVSAVILVLLMILRPALAMVKREVRTPVVAFLLDESTSMNYPIEHTNTLLKTRKLKQNHRFNGALEVMRLLQGTLSETHRVKLYTFSDTTRFIQDLGKAPDDKMYSELLPTGSYTHIGEGLEELVRSLQTSKISGLVLLSDGRQTGGLPLARIRQECAQAEVPVYSVTFGSEFPLRDLRIDEVIVPPDASLGDVLTFNLRITNQIRESLRCTIELLEEGKRILERPVILKRGENSVALHTIPAVEGERTFKIVLPRYDDEVDTDNNEANIRVKIIKRTVRVLLIAGEPTLEYYFLVPALLRDPIIELSCFLQTADISYVQQGNVSIERLPKTTKEWEDYDVVILYDIDPTIYTSKQESGIEHLVNKGGGLMVIAGRNHGLAKLLQVHSVKMRQLLPVEIEKTRFPEHNLIFNKPFEAVRTQVGMAHPIMFCSNDPELNSRIWETFPKLFWSHPITGLKNGAVTLLEKKEQSGSSNGALMAIHRYGEGAVMYIGINSLWRWRYPYGNYDYDRLWSRAVRYLGETKLKGMQKQVALSSDRQVYSPGQSVQLFLRIMDPALLEQLKDQPVFCEVSSPKGAKQMVTMRRNAKGQPLYEGRYLASHVGMMKAAVRQTRPDADSEAKPLFDISYGFEVKMRSLEQLNTSADLAAMAALAEKTEGKHYNYKNMDEVAKLPEIISKDPQVITRKQVKEVWDGWVFFIMFLCALSAEWSLRKLWGLL